MKLTVRVTCGMFVDRLRSYSTVLIRQNSAKLTRTGPNRCRIIECFGLSDGLGASIFLGVGVGVGIADPEAMYNLCLILKTMV